MYETKPATLPGGGRHPLGSPSPPLADLAERATVAPRKASRPGLMVSPMIREAAEPDFGSGRRNFHPGGAVD